jgi:glyoxylase-like metal-dependent hydrolase (beta-lactamase superfamily II)/rhodanese-related sulfurtransferase
MTFRQLFDPATSTYTYLLAGSEGEPGQREAILIDPVREHVEGYLALLQDEGLTLRYCLETHVHADHVTGSGLLRQRTGAETAVSVQCGATLANIQLQDGDTFPFGREVIQAIATPGHTPGSASFLWRGRLFTGDALLINGCGRTDFQGGDAGALYDAITGRLFALPDETLVYPGHDYNGRWVSCIGQERRTNARLAGKTRAEFIGIMAALHLPPPQRINEAVPANRLCGLTEAEVQQAPDPALATHPAPQRAPLPRQGTAQGVAQETTMETTIPLTVPDLIAEARQGLQEIPPSAAQGCCADGCTVVVDVREPEEYLGGHLPGAHPLPRGTLEFRIAGLPGCADTATPLLLYCKSGARAALAVASLKRLGYGNIRSLAGGMDAWLAAGLPVER